MKRRMILPPHIENHGLDGMRHRLAALPEREQPHAERAAEQPQNAHSDPACEKALTKDIPRAVQRHGPENEEDQRHGDGHGAGDDGRFLEFALLSSICFRRGRAAARSEFEVDVCFLGDVGVIAYADGGHGYPVVFLSAEGVGEDWDEYERTQQCRDVTRKHRVILASAFDSKATAFFLGGDEPGDEGDDEAEDGGESGGDPILVRPQEGEGGGR
jgi:hypothetical protein